MSKPLTFRRKIKLFRMYLKHQKDGVVVSCGSCGSTNVHFDNQSEQKKDKTIIYTSKYTCNECGSGCLNYQKWGEPRRNNNG